MKAIRALKIVLKDTVMSRERAYLEECIKELEELNNRSCDGCKYLEKKEKNLQFKCLIEICRTCSRNNNDNFEEKDSE